VQTSTKYFAFYDEVAVAEDVTIELRDEFNPLVVRDDIDRFRAACERMLANEAVSPAATNAYKHLTNEIGTVDSLNGALRAVGKLDSYYCDTPVLLGISFGSTGSFLATAVDGEGIDSDAAVEALYSMGESASTREMARQFISEMETAPASLATSPTAQQLNEVLLGGISGSSLDEAISIHASFTVLTDGSGLPAMSKFLYALKETDSQHARAYLMAVASQCSFAVRSTVTGEFGASLEVKRATTNRKRGNHTPAALGRLRFREHEFERFAPINSSTVLDASTVSWSRLSYHAYTNPGVDDTKQVCWESATMAFPDQLDEMVLKKLVSDRFLNSVLPPIVDTLKEAVAAGLQSGRISTLVGDPAERASLATNARSVEFKVAGAPRGSMFGREDEFERPDISSEDGALLMLLKQARAVFIDRMSLAVENQGLCQHPPLFPSLSRNAYLLSLAPCAMLLAGILVPPFASDRYDQSSLYGRIGFVVAHEVAHVASRTELWDESERTRLLVNYSRSTHAEAAADLTAADAVLSTGKTDVEALCGDVSQLWCARLPDWLYTIGVEEHAPTHPPPNVRGNNICSFLRL
jgi:hypothetical protein